MSMMAFADASRVSASAGFELSRGSAIELAGLRLTLAERSLYNGVRRALKAERIQGLQQYVRPEAQDRKSKAPPTFEQRKAWASRDMLLPRMGGAGAALRYYKAACELPHPLRQRPSALPSDLQAAIRYVSRKGARVVDDRSRRIEMLERQCERLAPLHRRLCELMPSHVAAIAGPMNLAFVACCVDAMQHPDRFLVHRFVHGFEVVGDIADSGCFRRLGEEERADATPVSEVFNRAENLAWIARLESSMRAQGNSPGQAPTDAAVQAYESTLDECAGGDPTTWGVALSRAEAHRTGRTHRGLSAEEVDSHPWIVEGCSRATGMWRPIRRFAIFQKDKWRPCDHARESLHNACTRPSEALAGQGTAEDPAMLARAFAEAHGGPVEMRGGTEDWPRAYRKAPVRSPRFNVVAVWNPYESRPEYFLLAGFNFGLVSAVVGFNRWPRFVIAAARAWLGCCAVSYFDDAFVGEPEYTLGSGQAGLVRLARLTGLPFAPGKHRAPSVAPIFVGVVTDYARVVSHGEIAVSVDPRRRASVLSLADATLAAGALTHTQAAKLAGKMRWALCPCFGRVGLALLRPLHAVRDIASPMPDELREAVAGLRLLADCLPPRTLPVLASGAPLSVVFTDAAFEAGRGTLGVVVKRPGRPLLWTACDCPPWVLQAFAALDRPKAQYIGQLELLAAVVAYTTFADELRGEHVIHWIDNESAVYSLVKGYTSAPDSARIVNLYHACVTQLGVTPWLEYVQSDDNIADLPSRGEFALLQTLGGAGGFRPAVVPSLGSMVGPLMPLLA